MSGAPRSFGPLARLTVRGLLGRRRTLGVVLLAAAPVVVALVLAVGGGLGDPETLALEVFARLTLGLVIPLAALVLGTAALGTEIDDGTVVYLLVKPVPRRTVIAAKMVVAIGATAALAVPAAFLATLLVLGASSPALLAGIAAGVLVAVVLYTAVFIALSVFTGRALVIGLGYVLVWEGLVTTLLEGTRILSIREYALAVVSAVAGPISIPDGGATVATEVALVLSATVLALAFVLAAWRLGRFEVTATG
jgi:ABC-2 type transport system permease protein